MVTMIKCAVDRKKKTVKVFKDSVLSEDLKADLLMLGYKIIHCNCEFSQSSKVKEFQKKEKTFDYIQGKELLKEF